MSDFRFEQKGPESAEAWIYIGHLPGDSGAAAFDALRSRGEADPADYRYRTDSTSWRYITLTEKGALIRRNGWLG
jgi:hypothetical protein